MKNPKSQSSGNAKTAETGGDNLSETSVNAEEDPDEDDDMDEELMCEDLDQLEAEEDEPIHMINKKTEGEV